VTDATLRGFLERPPATYCSAANGRFRWETRTDAAALGRSLGVGDLRELHVLDRGSSGRATAVRAVGGAGEATLRGELRIRQRLGDLKSSLFVVDRDGAEFVFRGGGWGHGVGMCQEGAIGMARQGRDFRAILEHYYRAATLVRLY
jgi:SpoIID/LytB domain protein